MPHHDAIYLVPDGFLLNGSTISMVRAAQISFLRSAVNNYKGSLNELATATGIDEQRIGYFKRTNTLNPKLDLFDALWAFFGHGAPSDLIVEHPTLKEMAKAPRGALTHVNWPPFPPNGWLPHPDVRDYWYKGSEVLTGAQLRERYQLPAKDAVATQSAVVAG